MTRFVIRDKQNRMYLTQFDGTEGWSDSDPPLQFLSYSEAKSVTLKLWGSLLANITGQSNVEVVMAPPTSQGTLGASPQ